MEEIDIELNEVERLLKKVRLAEPPEELRVKIVGAARETWEKAPADIPWRIPLRHLGLSAAAAVLIVCCANDYSAQAVAPWQAGRPVAARPASASLEDTPDMPYSPFVRHLIATCGAPASDASALLDYIQNARKTLDGAEQDNAADGSGPSGHESRLLPVGWKIDSYV
jgi:hypothetical protein